jgi:hypothetical protein
MKIIVKTTRKVIYFPLECQALGPFTNLYFSLVFFLDRPLRAYLLRGHHAL